LTTDYRIILPLMVSCIIGTLLSSRLYPDSIYTEKLARRGVRIRGGQDVNLLRQVSVSSVMRTVPSHGPEERLGTILERLTTGRATNLYVVTPDSHLEGVISLNDVRTVLSDAEALKDILVAKDLVVGNWPSVDAEDTLDTVVSRLDLGYRDELPVLDKDGRLLGAVHLEDVLARYRAELFKHEMAGSVAAGMTGVDDTVVKKVGQYVVCELDAPSGFWGKTLAELDVRQRFGLNVLLVREGTAAPDQEPAPPDAAYPLKSGDRMVVFGTHEQIDHLRRA
jgi:predicted transcriptional regulator